MLFVILFLSPVYFLIRRKWFSFVVNLALYILAFATLVFFVGPIFWLLAVAHAGWHYRKYEMHEHAKMIAAEMVKAQHSGGGRG